MYWRTLLILFSAMILCGCASVPKDSGFGDVQKSVMNRTGNMIRWNGHGSDDQAVASSVRAMLAQPLTADQATQIALLNNPHLQATFEDLGIAQADLVQAGLLKNPVFNLDVRFPEGSPSKTYLDIGAAEDFLDIAMLPSRKKLAADQFAQAKALVTQQVLSLAADAAGKFYTYQATQQLVELRRAVAQTMAASLEAATKLHDAGNISDLDFAIQQAQSARASVDLADAQSEADETRENVNDILGLWGTETQWTAASLPDLPAGEIHLQGLESLSVRQRADLAAARQDVLVQGRQLGMTEQFRLFQDLDLGADAERETDGQWRIGPSVSVPVPLFDQGQAAVAKCESMLRQSVERYFAAVVDARSEVRAASMKLTNTSQKARLYRDQILPAQQEILQQTQLQYNGAFSGVFDLLQAKRDEIDAQSQYVQSVRDYWIARVELQRAIGGRLPDDASTMPSTQSNGEMP
jgi:cobalt-zinc-cadmium efflux system outer membrane protein